jgi:hypothetical protein
MASVSDKDKGMANIQKMLKELKKTNLSVGVFSDVTNTEAKPTTYVADYAIANEYGIGHIPERSFMRSTVNEKRDEWSKLLSNVFMELVQGHGNAERELYEIGGIVRKDIIAKIDSNINPPNAPSTRKKKGESKNKTLIDHGDLRRSIKARITTK